MGDEADNRSQDRQNEWNWLRNGGWKDYRYLLTFNEPDFTDQSNMTPERAVELWKEIEPICDDESVDVSSPVVAIPTVFYDTAENDYGTVGGWYGKYDQLMATAECHDEFTAVHFYFDYPGEYVLDILEQIHEKTGKPLWITEWGVGQWTQVQDFDWTGGPDEGNWQRQTIVNFMNEVIPQIDQLDYVERYAWFPFDGSSTEKYGNGAGGLFFCGENDPLKGQLTAAGKAYKELGNPAGWNPDKVTEDMVVIDDGKNPVEPEKPIEPEKPDDKEKINVLAGKAATASSENGDNKAGNAIDGNAGSRWESVQGKTDAEWLQIDLGATYTVDSFKVSWENASAKEYKLQVSMDGKDWKDVYEVTDGASGETREGNFTSVDAKYIRLIGTSKTMEAYGYSIFELEVMGVEGTKNSEESEEPEKPDDKEKINVLAGKAATASSENGDNKAGNAIDGNAGSRWESVQGKTDAEWLQIDLGATYTVDSFKVSWENASAKEYKLQVSIDGKDWKDVYEVTDGASGEAREGNFMPVDAKYIRLIGTSKTMEAYGYSIFELEVMGVKGA